MAGTIISVIKKANANPNMMVHDNGFQNLALSPPKNMWGFSSENMVIKLMLKPIANGINASIAASAVSSTGIILVFPAFITASLVFMPRARSSSANSITSMPFLTTIPAKPTIPIPVITTLTCMPVMAKPSITPITLNNISVKIITGLLTELNCNTRMKRIRANAINKAENKNEPVSACCAASPVWLMVVSSYVLLKSEMAFASTTFTSLAVKPVVTLEVKLMVRFTFLRLMLP